MFEDIGKNCVSGGGGVYFGEKCWKEDRGFEFAVVEKDCAESR